MLLTIADARGAIVGNYSTNVVEGNGSFNLAAMMPEALISAASGAYFYRLTFTDTNGNTLLSRGNFIRMGR
jgi:hypothetical protein